LMVPIGHSPAAYSSGPGTRLPRTRQRGLTVAHLPAAYLPGPRTRLSWTRHHRLATFDDSLASSTLPTFDS
jgi:hypothetical protein